MYTSFAFPGSQHCVGLVVLKCLVALKISVKQWKKHFFKLSFLKKCTKQMTLFFIFNPWSIFHIFIHWFLEITFFASGCFFISWQTNKVILSARQKVSLVSTILYVTLYCTILFHLLLYKNENECMKMAELWKKKVVVTTLIHLKQWSGCY